MGPSSKSLRTVPAFGAIIALTGFFGFSHDGSAQDRVKWKMQSTFGSSISHLGPVGAKFAERVTEMSEGKFEIKFYDSGALVPSLSAFEAVSRGSIESAWTTPGYHSGILGNVTSFFSTVPFGPQLGEFLAWKWFGGGQELRDELYSEHGVTALESTCSSPATKGWTTEEFYRQVRQLRRLNIPSSSFNANIMQKLRISNQRAFAAGTIPGFNGGINDAEDILMPVNGNDYDINQDTTYNSFAGWHKQVECSELLLNKETYDTLPEAYRGILRTAAAENIAKFLASSQAPSAKAMLEIQKHNKSFFTLWNADQTEALEAAWLVAIEEMSTSDPVFKGIADSYLAFRNVYGLWDEARLLNGTANHESLRLDAGWSDDRVDGIHHEFDGVTQITEDNMARFTVHPNLEDSFQSIQKGTQQGDIVAVQNAVKIKQYFESSTNLQDVIKRIEFDANGGEVGASVLLGDLYLHGVDRERDPQAAIRLFEAASLHNPSAATRAADMYALGLGVTADFHKAEQFYLEAILGGSVYAHLKLGDLYRSRIGSEQDFGEMAYERYATAARKGNLIGTVRVGEMLLSGEGVEKDEAAAFVKFLEAANAGSAEGMNRAAELLNRGIGIEAHPERAVELWTKAAKKDNASAMRNLAIATRDGRGTSKNIDRAIRYFWASHDLGDQESEQLAEELVWEHCEGKEHGPCVPVAVFFATTREKAATGSGSVEFADTPAGEGQTSFGISYWNVPNDRKDEYREDSRFVVMHSQELFGKRPYRTKFERKRNLGLEQGKFFDYFAALDPAARIVLFVHGYNYSFNDATRRAAQFFYDLKFPGIPVVFSWPSRDDVLGYGADHDALKLSCSSFRSMLEELTNVSGSRDVQIVAHSMGSELVLTALTKCDKFEGKYKGRDLSEIVLAAPDVDLDDFRSAREEFSQRAERVTLYVSPRDKVINFVRWLLYSSKERLGTTAWLEEVGSDIDTIDASALRKTDFLGHSYVFQHPRVVEDATELLGLRRKPNCRTWPDPRYSNERVYWRLNREDVPPVRNDNECPDHPHDPSPENPRKRNRLTP